MIPKNIERKHIVEAIEEIKRSGVSPRKRSRKYYVSYENELFPVKYVISLANKYANGAILETHFGLYPYTQIHASGHLNYDEIREVVETVEPKVLIPVHTQHPEVFENFHDNVILPEKGVAISI
jgi:hypothetical protein